MLDIREAAAFADYFVICTAMNLRHLQALSEELDLYMNRTNVHLLHREGRVDSGWVLLDFGDVIVHLFVAAERQRYDLERLWRAAPPVVRVQ